MALESRSESAEPYVVRSFEPGDREGILDLLATQWGDRPRAAWFDWKYREDPVDSPVPITLAERDGEIVAVQGYVPCRIRRGERTVLARKPVDAVVHSDHRRQGLYTRITEHAIDRYSDGDPAFFLNFPNEASLGAQQKLGWSAVGIVSTSYRIHRPDALGSSPKSGGFDRLLSVGLEVARKAADRVVGGSGSHPIERYPTAPVDVLESLYESHVPDRLHARREAAYYRWLCDAPDCEHTVYLAREDDDPVAAVVTRDHGDGTVHLFDALPIGVDHDAFDDLLAAVVADAADESVLTVTDGTLPARVRRRFGFVSSRLTLLSRFTTPTFMAVRPLEPEPPFPDLTEADRWRVSMLEVTD
ncbi:GNAT family N-acetyltransferase [Natrarchaeobaculum aegyptiacum]|uniref:GNAT family N-acetyltransferase n=1 Tax=Natrarchaeobaculum aegyptiacum TaxID=745377 RepID=A0A2Z2HP98_9EURY|nr:GNAT family N-acetyltransferase [Natrarchaeobaculum aegyptiacum]ARS88373.1 GNAT family N-acetyltransferase [Natrarchaeobaculum aegyptiacum]